MQGSSTQNLANHRRLIPGYHFVLAPILLLNFGYAAWRAVHDPGADRIVALVVAFGLLVLWFYARHFALAVQDRVIRLEERLRFERLLPPDLQSRAGDLTRGQIIALRYSDDAELPLLAREVLDRGIDRQGEIKRMIKRWRADEWRA